MVERAEPQLTERRFKNVFFGLLILAFALFIVVVSTNNDPASFFEDDVLKVWFFDVGQGESVFIETPDDRQILVDGGPDASILYKLGGVMVPWDREIDALILSHPHADHVTGLNHVIERYRIGSVYETGARTHTSTTKQFDRLLRTNNIQHRSVQDGDEMAFGDLQLDVVWPQQDQNGEYPKDPNRTSLVLLLTYGEAEVLLTGDAYHEDERIFVSDVGDVDVLKVGHSGSHTSTSTTLIEHTQPEEAVISVGQDNSYGHPHPVVLDRLMNFGARVWRTDQHGDVLMTTNGTNVELSPTLLPF